MPGTVFCTAAVSEVESIIRDLHASGFSSSDISVLLAAPSDRRPQASVNDTNDCETAVGNSGVNEGWRDVAGTLTIPGLSRLIAAGPIMTAFRSMAGGGTLNSLTEVFKGLGVPEFEATRYARKVKSGSALIAVRPDDSEGADCAQEIFELAGADDVSAVCEATEEHCHIPAVSDRNFSGREVRVPWLL